MKKEMWKRVRFEGNEFNDENIYDYIANEYYRIDKETLKNLLLEFIYASDEDTTIEALESYYERCE